MRAVQVLEQGDDHFSRPEVQVPGRLVGEQNRGVTGQGSSDGNALLLTPRQLSRAV
jgi:hypothetical protein